MLRRRRRTMLIASRLTQTGHRRINTLLHLQHLLVERNAVLLVLELLAAKLHATQKTTRQAKRSAEVQGATATLVVVFRLTHSAIRS
jgi:hypothetical protein